MHSPIDIADVLPSAALFVHGSLQNTALSRTCLCLSGPWQSRFYETLTYHSEILIYCGRILPRARRPHRPAAAVDGRRPKKKLSSAYPGLTPLHMVAVVQRRQEMGHSYRVAGPSCCCLVGEHVLSLPQSRRSHRSARHKTAHTKTCGRIARKGQETLKKFNALTTSISRLIAS